MSVERLLKTVHSWLGVMILPWIVIAGLTGLYMNHSSLVLALMPAPPIMADDLDGQAGAVPQTEASAALIAGAALPDHQLTPDRDRSYRNRDVFTFDGDGVSVIVDARTGYSWIKSRYSIALYAPDGTYQQTEYRWGRIFTSLHERGWIGSTLGTWLADITAGALAVFGMTGLYLFVAPRLRRFKNRRARLAMAARNG